MAQLGALEFRKKLLEGNNAAVQNLRMGTQMTVADLLKVLRQLTPLFLIRLCNPKFANFTKEHILQHGDDLDFVQDVIPVMGKSEQLNPILHSVLAGFGRRRREIQVWAAELPFR